MHYSKNCTKFRCTSCDYITEAILHTFQTTGDTFYLKEDSDLVCVVICSTCNEGYTWIDWVRDRVRVCRQHIRSSKHLTKLTQRFNA